MELKKEMLLKNDMENAGTTQNLSHEKANHHCLISVGIPLYKSRSFLENIQQNCEVLAVRQDVEIIISDRHCLDDTIDVLQSKWGQDPRFKFLKSTDGKPWTQHMNILLSLAQGKYFRWMPHDDIFPEGSLELLLERLENDSNVILAYGPTRGIDLEGNRLSQRDRIASSPVQRGEPWKFQYSLDFNSKGYCNGAFKGLFRRKPIVEAGLYIRDTYELVGAERAWLFGVSLLGGLGEVSESIYLKRYHDQSTHARWRVTKRHRLSITRTMAGYLWEYHHSVLESSKGIIYLFRQLLK